MNELESAGKNTVIFSYEESYGYMIGHYVRDKDAVTASLLLTEMAAWYHAQGMTQMCIRDRRYPGCELTVAYIDSYGDSVGASWIAD